jgi:hypothetical protein
MKKKLDNSDRSLNIEAEWGGGGVFSGQTLGLSPREKRLFSNVFGARFEGKESLAILLFT